MTGVLGLFVLGMIGSAMGQNNSNTPVPSQNTAQQEATTDTNAITADPAPTSAPQVSEQNPTPSPTPKPTPNPTSEPAQIDRASVLAVLKANASTKWGDDYQMVQYEYNQQVEAYDWVTAQTKYPDIMAGAKQKWGNDYQMVKYEHQQQSAAYEWVMAQTAYPDIMAKAKAKWGKDYTMVKYEYENQVKAYEGL